MCVVRVACCAVPHASSVIGRGRGGRRGKDDEAGAWVPVTKLGRLVKDGRVRAIQSPRYFVWLTLACHYIRSILLKRSTCSPFPSRSRKSSTTLSAPS